MSRTILIAFLGAAWCCGLHATADPETRPFRAEVAAAPTLAEARRDLEVSRATLERIREALEALRARPDVDPSVLEDYSIYLQKVQAMVAAHAKTVEAIEALAGVRRVASGLPGAQAPDPGTYDPELPAARDELALLDRELDEALADIDAYLLEAQYEAARKMEQLGEISTEGMTDLAREAAAAVERLRNKGIDVDTRTPPGRESDRTEDPPEQRPGDTRSAERGDESTAPDGGGATDQDPQRHEGADIDDARAETTGRGAPGSAEPEETNTGSGAPTETADAGEPGEPRPDRHDMGEPGDADRRDAGDGGSPAPATDEPGASPPGGPSGTAGEDTPHAPREGDRPPADDDDIVARQLREAAEQETDPVLREKLWEEYDRYKGSS